SFAGMALGTLPFVFYLYPVCIRRLKAALVLLAIFSLTIVVFTGSRTGYVGFFGFATFVIVRARRKGRAIATALGIAAMAVPLVPLSYVERFDSIFTGVDKEGQSTEMRREILRDSWAILQSHPFGVGVGAFPAVRKATFGRVQDTHNLYFEIATN